MTGPGVAGGDAGGGRVLLVATRNAGKYAELRAPLEALGYRVLDLAGAGVAPSVDEEAIEVHDTFEENAVAKARFYHAASSGLPAVADDSGLVVEALGGAPGVHSRRWAGARGSEAEVTSANNAKLQAALKPGAARDARFVCVVAYVSGAGAVAVRGEVAGRIAEVPRGTHGFGYDPLFECADLGWRTFGEATADEKARVSHRGRALAGLYAHLRAGRDAPSGTGRAG